MTKKPESLRELIEQGLIYPAWLPEKNDFLFNEKGKDRRQKIIKENNKEFSKDVSLLNLNNLEGIKGYLAFLTKKDYGALSPSMWNTLFEKQNIDYKAIYFVGNPEDAEMIVNALKSDPKYIGGGFGSGWKEQFKYLNKIEPQTLKSVNFIVRDNKTRELIGYNTDIEGLLLPLKVEFNKLGKGGLENKTILIFGAGGVGKELPGQLVKEGVAKIYLINRTLEKVKKLAKETNEIKKGVAEYVGEDQIRNYLLRPEIDVVINVTQKGAEPLQDYSAFAEVNLQDPNSVRKNNKEALGLAEELEKRNSRIIIYDITLPKTGRPKTLEIAKKAGLTHLIRGTGMVINQGIIAVEKLYEKNPKMFEDKYDKKTIGQEFEDVINK